MNEEWALYKTIISPRGLKANLEDLDWIICDCRFDIHKPKYGYEAYTDGHIPGAIYVDLDKNLSSSPDGTNGRHPLPSPQTLTELIESLGISNRSQVIVYDDVAGGYAVRLWWILRYLGHDNVAVLDGGIQAWLAAGYALSGELIQRPRGNFQTVVQEDRLISVDQIQNRLSGQGFLLLDSRGPERYRGEEEPIDPIAGHIPGAENRHWHQNLDERGSFKTRDALRSELELLLHGRPAEDVIVYCGSGVTACHNLLAFVHAGYAMPRLYAGSWSEWSSDPAREIDTIRSDQVPE